MADDIDDVTKGIYGLSLNHANSTSSTPSTSSHGSTNKLPVDHHRQPTQTTHPPLNKVSGKSFRASAFGKSQFGSLEQTHSSTNATKITPVEDYLKPISVKDRSWGRQKFDISRLKKASLNYTVPSSHLPDDLKVSGAGFLDNPELFTTQKEVVADLLKVTAKDSRFEAEQDPIDPKDRRVEGLNVSLLDHQVRGLRFFLEREGVRQKLCGKAERHSGSQRFKHNRQAQHLFKQFIQGGLLCDDMGLGKTVQMLSLMLSNQATNLDDRKDIKASFDEDELLGLHKTDASKQIDFKKSLRKVKTTLIICPASLVSQWQQEIENRTNLTCYPYHGSTRIRNIEELSKFDTVITSYQTCMYDFQNSSSPLYECYWWRIILDEAHMIKNATTKTAIACFNVKSLRRWCLTGTPVQNDVDELWSLFHFLRINKYWEKRPWTSEISDNITGSNVRLGLKRLLSVLEIYMIRRNKSVLQDEFRLPAKIHHLEVMNQTPFEKAVYKNLEEKVIEKLLHGAVINSGLKVGKLRLKKPLMKGGSTDKGAYMVALVYLLRLRQICCHWQLLFSFKEDKDGKGGDELIEEKVKKEAVEDTDDIIDSMMKLFSGLNINEKSDGVNYDSHSKDLMLSRDSADNSAVKMVKVLEILRRNPRRKTIIFSEFTTMLSLLENELYKEGYKMLRYDGTLGKKQKQDVLDKMRDDSSYTILLCSLKCGALGLNLTFCTQVILYEPFWNPAIGAQAIDRVYRIGQTKVVDVWEFFVNDSVELRIKKLQDKKRDIAKAVTDKDPKAISTILGNKLTRDELFELVGLAT
ncbi:DEKNAAC101420 [Brettanomyces naardenensis]|uniref:DEKNAAC101420 n=1 Tax=Brettanomyces naardenensis TaxID=13370 RepID=A0A448YI91_BRENA|nr:DEKNAAC101420 [Brettanomyces naardenensis]